MPWWFWLCSALDLFGLVFILGAVWVLHRAGKAWKDAI